MSKNQKFNVHFYLNKKKAKEDNVQLYIRIVIDQKRVETATTHYIPISAWNQKTRKESGRRYAKS